LPHANPKQITRPHPDAAGIRSWIRLPWDLCAMTGGILYWGIGGLLVTLIGGPLHLILPKPLGVRFGRRLMQILFRQFVGYLRLTGLVRADLSALDSLAKLNHPVIVAPNHTSLWDAVFIIARLPQAICVMKKSILCNPFLGGGARLAGYIPNGTTTRMIRDAADALSHGGQLLLFPEGTRTRPDARWINPLKGGCALIAARAQVPVHPVFIRSNTRFLQKGWPLWKPPVFPIHISIETGPALTLLPGESPQTFSDRLHATFERELSKPHPLRRESTALPQPNHPK
jgi:1-acyl-sn-glycerol-3-phosphate acyltransferase